MCIIIDANRAHEFCETPPHDDAMPVLDLLLKKKIRVAIGGKLTKELFATAIRRLILELRRNGSAILYKSENLEKMEKTVINSELCVSDDFHILALGQISGARLLYTRDKRLIEDFTNWKILKPRGKVYSSEKNKDLLTRCPPCKDPA